MTKDANTAKWVATITVTLEPKNSYGDSTGDGEIRFTKTINAQSLTEVAAKLDKLDE
jgi:hypothetical protein